MAQSWPALCSKIASRYRAQGSREATRHYFGRAKHLTHQLVYDRWLDRLERKPSGRSYLVRPDQIKGQLLYQLSYAPGLPSAEHPPGEVRLAKGCRTVQHTGP